MVPAVRTGFVLVVSMAIGVAPGVAQIIPGGHPREEQQRITQRQMEYRSSVLRELNDLLADWKAAWAKDDVEALGRFYTPDAVLIPPVEGTTARSREEIERFYRETLPEAGEIWSDLSDFDVGGSMAYALGSYSFPSGPLQGSRPSGVVKGTFLAVFRREGGHWRIRSQVFESTH